MVIPVDLPCALCSALCACVCSKTIVFGEVGTVALKMDGAAAQCAPCRCTAAGMDIVWPARQARHSCVLPTAA